MLFQLKKKIKTGLKENAAVSHAKKKKRVNGKVLQAAELPNLKTKQKVWNCNAKPISR